MNFCHRLVIFEDQRADSVSSYQAVEFGPLSTCVEDSGLGEGITVASLRGPASGSLFPDRDGKELRPE